jgi:uncharacterized protein
MCLSKWAIMAAFMLLLAPWVSSDNGLTYKEIDWVDLLPDDDLQALMNPPAWLLDITDGSDGDDVELLSSGFDGSADEARFLQALKSSVVRPEMDQQQVRIPGYIVPLAFDDRRRTIEFFLVPYFGACLHLPPPPPNQIIYVNYEPGITIDKLYEPYWVEGVLLTSEVNHAIGDSAYRITAARIKLYEM